MGTRDFKLRGASEVSFHTPSRTDPWPKPDRMARGARTHVAPAHPHGQPQRWPQVTVRMQPLLGRPGASQPAGLVMLVTSLNSHESQVRQCHCVSHSRAPGHRGVEDRPRVAQPGPGQRCLSPGSLGAWLPLWTTAGELLMCPRLCPSSAVPRLSCCGPCPSGSLQCSPLPVSD